MPKLSNETLDGAFMNYSVRIRVFGRNPPKIPDQKLDTSV